jgi:hypothetical protein
MHDRATPPRPRPGCTRFRHLWPAAGLLALAVMLAGCGGGGDIGSATPAEQEGTAAQAPGQALSITLDPPQPQDDSRRIRLTWQARGASTFTVLLQRQAGAGFEAVDARIEGSTATFPRGAAWRLDFPTARVQVRACNPARHCAVSNAQPLLEVLLAGIRRLPPGDDYARAAQYGTRTAISTDGNVVAVSGDDDGSGNPNDPGERSVLVHRRDAAGSWTREARLNRFAFPVGLGPELALSGDGNTLVVGATSNGGTVGGVDPPEVGYPGPTPAPGDASGAAYVYSRDEQGRWQLQAYLKAATPRDFERFGRNIALSDDGDRLVVAGFQRLHVFTRNGSAWTQARELTPPGSSPQAQFWVGWMSMTRNGRSFAVSVSETSPQALRKVLVYEDCGCAERWRVAADLRSAKPIITQGGRFDDSFGVGRTDGAKSVSFSADGRTLAVGAYRDSGDIDELNTGRYDPPPQGSIYVFRRGDDGTWRRQAYLRTRRAADWDFVGSDLTLSADGRAIAAKACGASAFDPGLRRNQRADAAVGQAPPGTPPDCSSEINWVYAGAAYVFEQREDGRWRHAAAAIFEPGHLNEFVGSSLAFSGDAQTLAFTVGLFDGTADPRRLVVY